MESYFPNQGIEPAPLHWKRGVLRLDHQVPPLITLDTQHHCPEHQVPLLSDTFGDVEAQGGRDLVETGILTTDVGLTIGQCCLGKWLPILFELLGAGGAWHGPCRLLVEFE